MHIAYSSGDLELIGRSGPDHVKPTDHSTPWSSRGHHYSTTSLDPEVECLHPHHLTITRSHHSTTSLYQEVECVHLHYLIITRPHHFTRKSSITITTTRWQASEFSLFCTQLDTRAQGRKEDSSLSLDPSFDHLGRVQFWSIRVSEYFAISSMYFTFSRTSFYLVLFRRHCVLDLL